MSDLPFTPVVILGAPRSGTNALRDALCALPGFATWPCDEINPVWRHGNVFFLHDALAKSHARPRVRRYIRRAFERIWRAEGKPEFVVEKTCANTLRVPFVDAVLPEARYVVITRNGHDVVASAMKRWQGELEFPGLPYYLAKARYAPIADLPLYATAAIWRRASLPVLRLFGRKPRLSVWGPVWPGMHALKNPEIEELCARQWAACVSATDAAVAEMPPDKVQLLSYEDFVADPAAALIAILGFLGRDAAPDDIARAAGTVRSGSVGKSRGAVLPEKALAALGPTMAAHGMESP